MRRNNPFSALGATDRIRIGGVGAVPAPCRPCGPRNASAIGSRSFRYAFGRTRTADVVMKRAPRWWNRRPRRSGPRKPYSMRFPYTMSVPMTAVYSESGLLKPITPWMGMACRTDTPEPPVPPNDIE
jgi:hypothetical protein